MAGFAIGRMAALLVLFVVVALPGIAGLVLFIVGLATRKPALWGTGLGLMALVLLALSAAAAWYVV